MKPVVHGGQGQGVRVGQMLSDSPHSAPKVQLVRGAPKHPSVPDGQGIVITARVQPERMMYVAEKAGHPGSVLFPVDEDWSGDISGTA